MSDGSHREGPSSIAAALGQHADTHIVSVSLPDTSEVRAVLDALSGLAEAGYEIGRDPDSRHWARVAGRRWAYLPAALGRLTVVCQEPAANGALGALDNVLGAATMLFVCNYESGKCYPEPDRRKDGQFTSGETAFRAVEELVKRHGGLK